MKAQGIVSTQQMRYILRMENELPDYLQYDFGLTK